MRKKTYFAVMRIYRFTADGKKLAEQWFIHFSFKSKYQGEEDCSQHCTDLWDAFWKLPAVIDWKEKLKPFASPSEWNYIRELEEVNTSDIVMGQWVKSSPFRYDHQWQYNRSPLDIAAIKT
jgi:hypothetical protein